MKVKNKVIVITGAGNGMGRELALLLLSKGAKVAAVDISESALQETKELAGNNGIHLSTHLLDIINRDAVNAFPGEVTRIHGNVDGIFNNAGIIQPFVKVQNLEFDKIERVMNVNFYGLLNMTKAFLPYLLQRPEAHIINTSSMGGFLPVPGQSIYGASKAAVKLLTEGMIAELKETNVKVSIVFPGATGTNITANSGVATPNSPDTTKKSAAKTLPPDKAAQIIVTGVEKDKARIFVGKDSGLMDKLYRLSPGFATNLIAKQMKSLLKD